jgi:hypothetical protein
VTAASSPAMAAGFWGRAVGACNPPRDGGTWGEHAARPTVGTWGRARPSGDDGEIGELGLRGAIAPMQRPVGARLCQDRYSSGRSGVDPGKGRSGWPGRRRERWRGRRRRLSGA